MLHSPTDVEFVDQTLLWSGRTLHDPRRSCEQTSELSPQVPGRLSPLDLRLSRAPPNKQDPLRKSADLRASTNTVGGPLGHQTYCIHQIIHRYPIIAMHYMHRLVRKLRANHEPHFMPKSFLHLSMVVILCILEERR